MHIIFAKYVNNERTFAAIELLFIQYDYDATVISNLRNRNNTVTFLYLSKNRLKHPGSLEGLKPVIVEYSFSILILPCKTT